MHIPALHSWDLTPRQAVELQRSLAERIDASCPLKRYRTVAGADVSHDIDSDVFYAGVIPDVFVFSVPSALLIARILRLLRRFYLGEIRPARRVRIVFVFVFSSFRAFVIRIWLRLGRAVLSVSLW